MACDGLWVPASQRLLRHEGACDDFEEMHPWLFEDPDLYTLGVIDLGGES
jgi:hypothetical protein